MILGCIALPALLHVAVQLALGLELLVLGHQLQLLLVGSLEKEGLLACLHRTALLGLQGEGEEWKGFEACSTTTTEEWHQHTNSTNSKVCKVEDFCVYVWLQH
jgi:hypothetical protein